MQNKLEDLNNHLYEALERLNDDEYMENSSNAEREIKRAFAIKGVAEEIIKSEKTINERSSIQVEKVKILLDNGYEITPTQQQKFIGIEYDKKNKERTA